ncbi:MAG: hypothetical protein HZA48_12240, partial [Planctomycetes bacterium]|nr:hypothetical protein [Planctomycetota bacterium]
MRKLCYVCLWLIALAIIPWFGQYGVYGDDGPGDDDSGGVQDQLVISQHTVTPVFSPNNDGKTDTCKVEGIVDAKLVASLGNNSSDKNQSEKDYYIKVKSVFTINSVVVKTLSALYQVQPGTKQKTNNDNNGNSGNNDNGNSNGNSGNGSGNNGSNDNDNGNGNSDDNNGNANGNGNNDDNDDEDEGNQDDNAGSDDNDDDSNVNDNDDSDDHNNDDNDDDDENDSDDNGHSLSQSFSLIWSGLAENNAPAIEGAYTVTTTAYLIITTKNAKGVDDPKNIHRTSQPVTDNTVLDLSGPVITISPANGSTINTKTPTITITYSDNLSGTNLSTLNILIDNVNSTALFTVTQDSASYTIPENAPLSIGSHSVSVTIADSQGISSTITSVFTVDTAVADTTPPVITISPINGSLLGTGTPLIDISYSEDVSNIDTATLSVTIDNVDSTSLFAITNSSATYTIPSANTLSEGIHTVTASIANTEGLSSLALASFTIDLSGPIVIISPLDGSTINTETPGITVSYADNLSGINIASIIITIDNVPSTPLFTVTNTSAAYTVPASALLSEGAHSISAVVGNTLGLTTTSVSTFTIDVIDATLPQITNLSPAQNSATTDETPAISASFADNRNELVITDVSVFFNNTNVTADSNITIQGFSYTAPAPLIDGIYAVSVTGLKDKDGNTVSAQWLFYVATATATVTPQAPAVITVTDTQSPIYGTTLDIPQNAVVQPVDISILEIAQPAPIPAELIELSPPVDLQPDGTQFAVPVGVTLSYDEQAVLNGWVSEQGLKIYFFDMNMQIYRPLNNSVVNTTANTVSADISQINGLILMVMGKPMTSFEISNYTSPLTAGSLSSMSLRAVTDDGYTVESFNGLVKITLTGINDRWNVPYFTDVFYVTFTDTDKGVMSISNIFTMVYSGLQTIKAEVVDYPEIAGTANIEVIPSAPQMLSKLGGDNQYAGPNETLPEMFSVKLTDTFGNPISQKNVAFEKKAGYGYFENTGVTATRPLNDLGITASGTYKTAGTASEDKIKAVLLDENVPPSLANISTLTEVSKSGSPAPEIANPDIAFALDPETGIKLICWEENGLLNPGNPADPSVSTSIYTLVQSKTGAPGTPLLLDSFNNNSGYRAFPCVTFDLQYRYFVVVYCASEGGANQMYRLKGRSFDLNGILKSTIDIAAFDYPLLPAIAYDSQNGRHMAVYPHPAVNGFALSIISLDDYGNIMSLASNLPLYACDLFKVAPVRPMIPALAYNAANQRYVLGFMSEEYADNPNIPELRKVTPVFVSFTYNGLITPDQPVSNMPGYYVPPDDVNNIRRLDVASGESGFTAVWEDYSQYAFLNNPLITELPPAINFNPTVKYEYAEFGQSDSISGFLAGNAHYPRIAYDPVHKMYLMCWTETSNGIYAQQLKIQIDSPMPPAVNIQAVLYPWANIPMTSGYSRLGKLAYNAPEEKFVLVASASSSNNSVLTQSIMGLNIDNTLSAYFYVHPETAVVPAPIKLTAIPVQDGIALAWELPEYDYAGMNAEYKIYRTDNYNSNEPNLSNFLEIGTAYSGNNSLSWTDTTAEKYRKYYYCVKIRANLPQGAIDSLLSNVTAGYRDYPVNAVPPLATEIMTSGFQEQAGIRLEIWTALPQGQDFTGYFVYRSAEENGVYEKVNVVPAIPFSDNHRVIYYDSPIQAGAPGTLYYKVTAVDFFGNESTASVVQAIYVSPYFPPISSESGPFPPSGITAYGLENSIAINWIPGVESNLSYYNVYRTSGASNKLVNVATTSETHYVDTNVTNGQIYEYTLTAVNKLGYASDYSVTVETRHGVSLPEPAAPVVANAIPGDSAVAFQWNLGGQSMPYAEKAPVDHYEINYTPSLPGSINTESSIYTIGGLENGTAYNFSITAVSIYGTSASAVINWATPAAFVIPAPIITSPENNSWLSNNSCNLNVTIDSSIDITLVNSMNIYVNGTLQSIVSVFGTSVFTAANQLQEGPNTISVILEDRYGRKSASATVQVTVPFVPPSAPTGFAAVQMDTHNVDNTNVRMSWQANLTDSDVAGYWVYKNGSRMNTSLLTGTQYDEPVNYIMNGQTNLYYVTAQDVDGMESEPSSVISVALSFTYDPPPVPEITSPQNGAYVNAVSLSLAINGGILTPWHWAQITTGKMYMKLFVNGVLSQTLYPVEQFTYADVTTQSEGVYTFGVQWEDYLGRMSGPSTIQVTIDRTPPSAPLNPAAIQLETMNVNNTFVRVSWQANTVDSDIAGYRIYRNDVRLNDALIAQTQYSDPVNSTMNGQANTYSITAVDFTGLESPASAQAVVVLTFISNPLAQLVISGTPASVIAGAPVSMTITAKDTAGQTFSGYTGIIKITYTGTVSPNKTYKYPGELYFEFTPAMQGVGVLQDAILFYETGLQTITAVAIEDESISASAQVDVRYGPAEKLFKVSGDSQQAHTRSPVAQNFSVKLMDFYENGVGAGYDLFFYPNPTGYFNGYDKNQKALAVTDSYSIAASPVYYAGQSSGIDSVKAVLPGVLESSSLDFNGVEFSYVNVPDTDNKQPKAASANNPTNNTCAVVWLEKDMDTNIKSIKMRVFDSAGEPLYDAVTIRESETLPITYPGIAYNSIANNFLVLWLEIMPDTSTQVVGTIADSTGAPYNSTAYQVNQISSGINIQKRNVPVVFNAWSWPNEYFIVWETDSGNNLDIRGAKVNAEGLPMDGYSDIAIATTASQETAPSLTLSIPQSQNSSEYVIAYDEFSTTDSLWLPGIRKISSSTGQSTAYARFASLYDAKHPYITYSSGYDQYMMVYWQNTGLGTSYCSFVILNQNLSKITGARFTPEVSNIRELYPKVAYGRAIVNSVETDYYLAAWNDYRNDFSGDVYYQMIPVNGIVTTQINNAMTVLAGYQDVQSIIFNNVSRKFVIVWTDRFISLAESRIKASLLGPNCTDSSLGIMEKTDVNISQYNPQVTLYSPRVASATNSKYGGYAVVWREVDPLNSTRKIKLQITDSDGYAVSEPIVIRQMYFTSFEAGYVNICYNENDNTYLIVWLETLSDYSTRLFGTIADSNGAPVNSNEYTVNQFTNDTSVLPVELVHNTQNNEYLLSWVIYANSYNIRAVRISNMGNAISDAFNIAAESVNASDPVIAYNSTNNEYCVVYKEFYNGQWGLSAKRLDSYGNVIAGLSGYTPSYFSYKKDISVAYNPDKNEYVVVYWKKQYQTESQLCYDVLSSTLARTEKTNITGWMPAIEWSYSRIAYDTVQNRYLVLWDDYRNGVYDGDIYYQILDKDGNLSGNNVPVVQKPGYQNSQDLGFNKKAGNFLVVWLDGGTTGTEGSQIKARTLGPDFVDVTFNVEVFSITGQITVNLGRSSETVRVYDEDGNFTGVSGNTDGTGAITFNLPEGAYWFVTDDGSYISAVTADSSTTLSLTDQQTKLYGETYADTYNDSNDFVLDINEFGMPYVTINLHKLNTATNKYEPFSQTESDVNGLYEFKLLPSGTYKVIPVEEADKLVPTPFKEKIFAIATGSQTEYLIPIVGDTGAVSAPRRLGAPMNVTNKTYNQTNSHSAISTQGAEPLCLTVWDDNPEDSTVSAVNGKLYGPFGLEKLTINFQNEFSISGSGGGNSPNRMSNVAYLP